jgi:iron complex outermembrane receptor protein/outer membrane receptor for ferrienterochelin and colicins
MVKRAKKHQLIGGVNVTGDVFSPSSKTPVPVGKFANNIIGVFGQDTWRLFNNTKLEAGLRFDHHDQFGNFLLPRIALFQRFNEHWGGRAGFGMGYLTPNPLTPQTKDYSIYQLQPLNNVKAEKSYAGNVEVNYKTDLGKDGTLFINQAFFLTTISNPVVSVEDVSGKVFFTNESDNLLSRGSDTYVQVQLSSWEFYLGYTYTNAIRTYLPANRFVLYTPMHRAAATTLYELAGKWRVGLEASYNGYQRRDDYSKTPGYLFMAAMMERKFGPKWSLVLNCENLLDERQSRHEQLYTGPVTSPEFKTLWAPIDGRILNLCVRFRPFEKAG